MGLFRAWRGFQDAKYSRETMRSTRRLEDMAWAAQRNRTATLEVKAGSADVETITLGSGGRETIVVNISDRTGKIIHRVPLRLHLKDIS